MPLYPAASDQVLNPSQIVAQNQQTQLGNLQLQNQKLALQSAQQELPYKSQQLQNQSTLSDLSVTQAKNNMVLQLLGNVKDQNSYDQAKAIAQSEGLPTNHLPPQYDPSIVNQLSMSALSLKDQFDYKLQQQEQQRKNYDSGFTPSGSAGNLPAENSPVPINGTAGATNSGTPLSVQNNNPGNLKDTNGNFMQFNSPQEGMFAMKKDLLAKIGGASDAMKKNYGDNYQPTLTNVISTYAPSSENNTSAYISTVAQKLGVDPNKPLDKTDIDRLATAMTGVEGGQTAGQYFNGEQNTGNSQIPQFANKAERDAYYATKGKLDAQNVLASGKTEELTNRLIQNLQAMKNINNDVPQSGFIPASAKAYVSQGLQANGIGQGKSATAYEQWNQINNQQILSEIQQFIASGGANTRVNQTLEKIARDASGISADFSPQTRSAMIDNALSELQNKKIGAENLASDNKNAPKSAYVPIPVVTSDKSPSVNGWSYGGIVK